MLNGDRIRFVLAGAVLACSGACAAGAPTHAGASWRTLAPAYAVQSGSGDIVASDGMSVTLVGPVGTHGSAFYVLSPSSYANRRITVEADMDSAPASGKAVIFANAKTVTGHRLFANAERGADLATAVGHRVFMLDVPSNVQYLSLGLGVTDGGKLEATRLHITTSPIPPHAAPRAVMDAVLSDIKAHALEAGRIDWPTVEPSMRAYALASEVPAEIYPQIDALIKMLGDGHSLWMRPGARHAYDTGGTSPVAAQVALRDESVGYVSMPGFPGMNAAMSAAFVHDIASRIDRLAPRARDGWIVDLRTDTGGNMHPMLDALGALLGSGNVGGFKDRAGAIAMFPVPHQATGRDLSAVPVAVLIGPRTSSSGEVTAIAFEGRDRTTFIGQPSDGRTTSNETFYLPDGSVLFLADAHDVDRTGKVYVGPIVPDQVIEPTGADVDGAIDTASRWLRSRKN